ncbi:MAG TPA: DUF3817 domain-containing protein [Chthoniobacterales bacterium]|jgi:integral membrane protein
MPAAHLLRLTTLAEGVSFLLLLGVAMPLKYAAGLPQAVIVVGWLHGVLFMGVCGLLAALVIRGGWPIGRAALVLLAALVPFGPFVIDGRLKHYESGH